MNKNQELTNLEQLLDRIADASRNRDRVSLSAVLELVGRRSFGPLLLIAGVFALAPVVGDIPGVPTLTGTMVFLITIQMLFGREYFWLPAWLLERSVASDRLCKALRWLRSPARIIDRMIRPRLTVLTKRPVTYGIALACIIIAIAMPAMEVVLFVANGAGAALAAFGLSLIAHDGLLALIAFILTAITVGLVVYTLLI